MNVEISEVQSTVRAVDSGTLLSPRIIEQIVAAVARVLHDGQERDKRVDAERRITGGVSAERDEGR
jgi:hypothetical protein